MRASPKSCLCDAQCAFCVIVYIRTAVFPACVCGACAITSAHTTTSHQRRSKARPRTQAGWRGATGEQRPRIVAHACLARPCLFCVCVYVRSSCSPFVLQGAAVLGLARAPLTGGWSRGAFTGLGGQQQTNCKHTQFRPHPQRPHALRVKDGACLHVGWRACRPCGFPRPAPVDSDAAGTTG
jgi:hypothetical protein